MGLLIAMVCDVQVAGVDTGNNPESNTDASSSANARFTRVMVYDLKPDVLEAAV